MGGLLSHIGNGGLEMRGYKRGSGLSFAHNNEESGLEELALSLAMVVFGGPLGLPLLAPTLA